MLSFTGSLKIFVALEPCDMRAGANTLQAWVSGRLQEDARSGALFVFTNKRRSLLKVLYWDGTGLWIMSKRLEKGEAKLKLAPEAFAMLTDGVELKGAKLRPWYERE